DAPENTDYAIDLALRNHADVIWISLQLSNDGVPVLYRPNNLNALSNGQGLVSEYTVKQLQGLDAGWNVARNTGQQTIYQWRGKGIRIPTLQQVLTQFPRTT
ncbi:glycerophosphodiester phosphodiesterase family protein, partial [Acinetobacter guillouiae]|uniref:glycerophosphodiester phosphodiesterase family protein n=1 Tax=Acinetobacter guillouiae TaxID=106649 RepID=UPI003AF6C8E6